MLYYHYKFKKQVYIFPLSNYYSYLLKNCFSSKFVIWTDILPSDHLEHVHLAFVSGTVLGMGVISRLVWAKCFTESTYSVRMCTVSIFKVLWHIFRLFQRHRLHKQQCDLCKFLKYIDFHFAFAFPIRQSQTITKWLCPLISCFSPGPAASNYLLPPAGPPLAVLRLVPLSKTTRKVTWA